MSLRSLFHTILLAMLLATTAVRAEPVEVTVDGEAASKEAAIAKALVEALQQVTGVAITATQQSGVALTAIAQSDGTAAAQLTEASQAELIRQTNGVVRSYRILNVEQMPGLPVVVHIAVVIEKYTTKGLGNDSRRRLAVAPFTDANGKTNAQGLRFQQRLSAYLVQTRRFAVLDRSNDAAYESEMALIASNTVTPAERARLGQVIGADYVVVGHLQSSTSKTTETPIAITGEIASNTTTTNGRAEYSVIEIATRQVKWSGMVGVGTADDVAVAQIGDQIIEALYPLRIIDVSDPHELVINQGGGSLKVGLRFKVFALSAEMFDPYTKESLGRREREVGTVEVIRVMPKMSYARLVQGKLPDGAADLLIRRAADASASRPAKASIAPTANTPLKLPFD